VDIWSEELGMNFLVINIYEPYLDRVPFQEALLKKYFMNCDSLILGGDINFSVGAAEIWGPKTRTNPLYVFFIHILDEKGLSDVALVKLNPTWRNMRVGEDIISKRIDRFLISEKLLETPLHIR
jgi:hypothetical protein